MVFLRSSMVRLNTSIMVARTHVSILSMSPFRLLVLESWQGRTSALLLNFFADTWSIVQEPSPGSILCEALSMDTAGALARSLELGKGLSCRPLLTEARSAGELKLHQAARGTHRHSAARFKPRLPGPRSKTKNKLALKRRGEQR